MRQVDLDYVLEIVDNLTDHLARTINIVEKQKKSIDSLEARVSALEEQKEGK